MTLNASRLLPFALAPALALTAACDADVSEFIDNADTVYTEEITQEEVGSADFTFEGINEDCTDDDPDDNTTFSRRVGEDGTQYCMIAIDWRGLLISMTEIRDEIEAGLEEGEAPEQVSADEVEVTFKDISIDKLSIELIQEDEDGDEVVLAFDDVTYYLANIEIKDVGDLVQIDWPDAENPDIGPDSPVVDVVGDEEGDETGDQVITYLNEAYAAQDDVDIDGHAELEFVYESPEDLLAMNGSTLRVDFQVSVTGEGSVGISEAFSSEQE